MLELSLPIVGEIVIPRALVLVQCEWLVVMMCERGKGKMSERDQKLTLFGLAQNVATFHPLFPNFAIVVADL